MDGAYGPSSLLGCGKPKGESPPEQNGAGAGVRQWGLGGQEGGPVGHLAGHQELVKVTVHQVARPSPVPVEAVVECRELAEVVDFWDAGLRPRVHFQGKRPLDHLDLALTGVVT